MPHQGLLDINGLSARYPGGEEVLHDVSLHIHHKEIVCIIGESGCGKTTLLNAILQMPGRVDITEGQILYKGQDIRTLQKEEIRRLRGTGIGIVYQEPGASMDPIRKIRTQFFETICAHRKISKKEALKQAASLLARMGLQDSGRIFESCPVQLSGGMNQRVAIALAMALNPDILLADEPTSALDVTVQAQLVEELLQLRDELSTAILIVTHNMGIVEHMADKVAVMYGGRIVEYGYRRDVLTVPAHPYTRALMSAIPKLDGIAPIGIPGVRPKNSSVDGCAFASRCPHAKDDCLNKTMEKQIIGGVHWTLCRAGLEDGSNHE